MGHMERPADEFIADITEKTEHGDLLPGVEDELLPEITNETRQEADDILREIEDFLTKGEVQSAEELLQIFSKLDRVVFLTDDKSALNEARRLEHDLLARYGSPGHK